jgi:hypothetical protein
MSTHGTIKHNKSMKQIGGYKMTKQIERDVTREQAELLFNMDSSIPRCSKYRLILVPTNDEVEPFETEAEVSEFLMWANQKWLSNETW